MRDWEFLYSIGKNVNIIKLLLRVERLSKIKGVGGFGI